MYKKRTFDLPSVLRAIEVVLAIVIFALPLVTELTFKESLFITLACFFIIEAISLLSKLKELLVRLDQNEEEKIQKDKLLNLIRKCDLKPEQLEEVFQTMVDIFEKRHPVLQDIAKWKFLEFHRSLAEIRNGRFPHSRKHPRAYGRTGMRRAMHTLDAITMFDSQVVSEFWLRKLASGQYLQANIAAINRGVAIRRIFLYDGSLSEGDHIVLTQQYMAGVHVFVLDKDEISADFYEECFIVADSETSHAFASTTIFDGKGLIVNWVQTDEHQTLLEFKSRFRTYLEKSTPYIPPNNPSINNQDFRPVVRV